MRHEPDRAGERVQTRAGATERRMRVDQAQEGHAFARALQLACHLESDQAAKRPTGQRIGSVRLAPPQRFEVARCELLDVKELHFPALKAGTDRKSVV